MSKWHFSQKDIEGIMLASEDDMSHLIFLSRTQTCLAFPPKGAKKPFNTDDFLSNNFSMFLVVIQMLELKSLRSADILYISSYSLEAHTFNWSKKWFPVASNCRSDLTYQYNQLFPSRFNKIRVITVLKIILFDSWVSKCQVQRRNCAKDTLNIRLNRMFAIKLYGSRKIRDIMMFLYSKCTLWFA